MLKIHKFTFNPFQENTYILTDETSECVIIDPGCSNPHELARLIDAVSAHNLTPVGLWNTHCHIDHIPGNKPLCEHYNLLPKFHENEREVMFRAIEYSSIFGIPCEESPLPQSYLEEGDTVSFGNTTFDVIFTPGHSPGSISFYNAEEKVVFSGDVLFRGSVGRFDLPGADGETLYNTLTTKMMTLPDDVKVYSGHGPETFIGVERRNNPFMQKAYFFQ